MPLTERPARANNDQRFDIVAELYSLGAGGDADLELVAAELTEALGYVPPNVLDNVRGFVDLLRGEVLARAHYERLSR